MPLNCAWLHFHTRKSSFSDTEKVSFFNLKHLDEMVSKWKDLDQILFGKSFETCCWSSLWVVLSILTLAFEVFFVKVVEVTIWDHFKNLRILDTWDKFLMEFYLLHDDKMLSLKIEKMDQTYEWNTFKHCKLSYFSFPDCNGRLAWKLFEIMNQT